jgi:hypothetical protein
MIIFILTMLTFAVAFELQGKNQMDRIYNNVAKIGANIDEEKKNEILWAYQKGQTDSVSPNA